MDPWRQYLFERHSEDTLRAWAKRLHAFRFFRAFGGHVNDSDSLDVAYAYRDVDDLHRFFAHVGLSLRTFAEPPPQPEPGVAYAGPAFAGFPALIPGTRWIEQPRHRRIAGHDAFAWCEAERIVISVGTQGEVSEAHVEAAEAIETVLVDAPLVRIDPPVDTEHYVCPKYYPAWFA